jgi:hypothetical protein
VKKAKTIKKVPNTPNLRLKTQKVRVLDLNGLKHVAGGHCGDNTNRK